APSRRAGSRNRRAPPREVGRVPARVRGPAHRREGGSGGAARVRAVPPGPLQGPPRLHIRGGAAENGDGQGPEVRPPRGESRHSAPIADPASVVDAKDARRPGHNLFLFNSNASSNAVTHGRRRSCPYQEDVMDLDMYKLNAFLGRAVVDIGATLHAALVLIGEKLGLYKALAA